MPKNSNLETARMPLSFCVRDGKVWVTDADERHVLSIDLFTVEKLMGAKQPKNLSIRDLLELHQSQRPPVIDVDGK